jgi:6-phosphogluconolactonase
MKTASLNRRDFLVGSAALPFAMRAMVAEGVRSPQWVLLGTDKGKGIYRASWNAATGELGPAELVIASDRPSYFSMHPKRPILYVANEAAHGDGSVSSFHVDEKAGALQELQHVSSGGSGPCYVSVDQTGKSVFVANYGGGSATAYGVKADGTLEMGSGFDCRDNATCGVTGPNAERQDAPHLHCAVVSPDDKYLLVCNLGEDAIEVFPIFPDSKAILMLGTPLRVATRAGSGPRHVAFHPNGRWVYCIHELDCTIDVFGWNKGTLTPLGDSMVSTLVSEASRPGSTGCEILVSDHGKFVYANTRGENSLTVYRVNEKTGLLTEQQRVNTGGTVTRLIAIDPSKQWLLCMNQGSSTVTVFKHDPKTGKLGNGGANEKPKVFLADSPMCVEWV